MSELTLEKVPVEFAAERLHGELSIRQDDSGRLALSIAFDSGNYEGGAPIKTVQGFSPVVTIEPAYYGGWYSEGRRESLAKVQASKVVIEYEPGIDQAELVMVKYVLGGERQDVSGCNLILDNRPWRFDVEHNPGWYGKALKEGATYVPLEAALITQHLPLGQLDSATATVHKALPCLSFALGGIVGLARIEVFAAGAKPVKTILFNLGDPERHRRPPVPIEQLAEFIQWTYPRLDALDRKLKFPNLLRILAWARNQYVLEFQALNLAGVLELLRYQFANSYLVPAGKAKRDGDKFVKMKSGQPVTTKNKRGKEIEVTWSFAEIHLEMAKEFGLSRWNSRFTNFRNAAVHTGTPPGSDKGAQIENIMEVMHFCDTVVLALLDWDKFNGKYVPCWVGSGAAASVRGYNPITFAR
ncbi:MAG TPA: hypothetical protein PLC24_12140 [Myxococcota bacterium]|nr:hypothetical protein [Myxococcota bacterium]